ncbi:di- and tricarboxylate transporters [Desulfocucumis palustris]|uniref:Sodium-dependent dicarboxylate transporter SdcS n=1 Tax=Desulfocucumis palustris TaxID=1898651 RepID=A0A2L2X8I5_9FIRM|nr:SLC13 family permease [Desulfocucumis palustris]GBF32529.1 di- and tricarboxylate transporters [Desulfocucumis palustris]
MNVLGIPINPKKETSNVKKMVFGALGVILALYIWFFLPAMEGLEPAGQKTMAVFIFMIMWWIGEVVSPVVVSLLGVSLFTFFGVAKSSVAFSGFSSGTLIFLIFAFLMAAAITKTGLGKRLAGAIISRSNPSYKTVLFLLMFAGLLLGAIIPSGNARIVLLGTIALSLLNIFDQSADKISNIGKGFFILLGITSMISCDPFITGGASTVLLWGLLSKAGIDVSYFDWFLNLLPICLIAMVILWFITYKLFPPEVERLDEESYRKLKDRLRNEVGVVTSAEKKVAIYTLLILALWIFGSQLKVSSLNACMAGVVLMFLPGIGVLNAKDIKGLPWDTLVFIGCCLSLGQVISTVKLDTFLASVVSPLLISNSIFILGFKLVLAAMIIHFIIADALPIFTIFIPIVIATMQKLGVNPLVGAMFFQMGTTAYMMLYQQAQAITVYGFGQFKARDFMKVGAWTYVLWIVMIPVMVLWWSVRGLM